mmetsp:Transcript_10856/g.18214  ORF Transcript_10856/g.18214 Transcript_10856/m.18214 type:complete len:347 (-) Transcript_10856:430-1470(-)|eukprot:CAMPEP_0119319098 /NCGR_PEP_ID=MMETSP1333-20130426/48465_1 /TAXON_ID=418940 /ORGANISM="Scyphosphaera apsteinii, Strain RCC1455" /LENGTH=346 /DNA_ID=CAMNT_0007325435 /DNA_START=122 /DNA_END=1162 /DNA_ORIENTATION=+
MHHQRIHRFARVHQRALLRLPLFFAQMLLVLTGAAAAHDDGEPAPLPGLWASASEGELVAKRRGKQYGGKMDKQHLGGFSFDLDIDGISPGVWRWMLTNLTVRSVIDVGCGIGTSASWFMLHSVRTRCVEGSKDATSNSLLPPALVVEHDFTRGPWWPGETYDIAWAVEFLEHVGRPYINNYMPSLQKAAYLFVTHSTWGGWHHVEVHRSAWWQQKFEAHGFVYQPELTRTAREIALSSQDAKPQLRSGKPYRAQHLFLHLLIFVNPRVASLQAHAHLLGGFPDLGCVSRRDRKGASTLPCTGADELPPEFRPLQLTSKQDAKWIRLLERVNASAQSVARPVGNEQ